MLSASPVSESPPVTKPQDPNQKPGAPAKARSALRLVPPCGEAPSAAEPPQADAVARAPRRKSQLVKFMAAYADAIDNDIKAILDL
jgi:hypothetical protein